MADETATLDSTMEADLQALLGGETSKPAGKPAVASPTGDQPGSTDASPETPAETDPILAALDEIEEDAVVKPEDNKPALSSDQQAVLQAIPDIQTATNLYAVVDGYNNLTKTFESGDFDNVEKMFESWNPEVLENWKEHMYKKYVSSGEWVDRFIAEAEGKGQENKGLTKLQKEFNALKASIEEKKTVNAKDEAQKAVQASFQAYNRHVDELFEKVNFNKADRKWVVADLNARVAADPKAMTAVKSGNVKAVNALFKAACKDYVNRDKEVVTGTAAKIETQEKKKLPLGGGAGSEDTVPDDYSAIKVGDEEMREKSMLKQLGNLFKSKK